MVRWFGNVLSGHECSCWFGGEFGSVVVSVLSVIVCFAELGLWLLVCVCLVCWYCEMVLSGC